MSTMVAALILSVVVCLMTVVQLSEAATGSAEWSYSGKDGPANWPGACTTGRKQSPINLNVTGNKVERAEPFRFHKYGNVPPTSFVGNKGKNVKFEIKDVAAKDMPQVTGGGLKGRYNFAQFHFHWGNVHTIGSEHIVSEESYPMELHLVHFNQKYGDDLGGAITKGNGAQDTLAVLGIMFRMTEKDNQKLQPLIETMKDVKNFGKEAKAKKFPLIDLLPVERNTFYRYDGSLTTPGCNEIVIWTVFKNPIDISKSQMTTFRDLTQENEYLMNNFRPAQPLNGRIVYDMDSTPQTTGGASGMSPVVAGLISAGVVALFAAASGKN